MTKNELIVTVVENYLLSNRTGSKTADLAGLMYMFSQREIKISKSEAEKITAAFNILYQNFEVVEE